MSTDGVTLFIVLVLLLAGPAAARWGNDSRSHADWSAGPGYPPPSTRPDRPRRGAHRHHREA